MDWAKAIQRNCEALLRIVAELFALAQGGVEVRLPRHVYFAMLRILRPAESALRRLIILAAHGLVLKPRGFCAFPATSFQSTEAKSAPAFALLDSLKHFEDPTSQTFEAPLPRISVPGFIDPTFLASPIASRDDFISAQRLYQRLNALKRVLDNLRGEARRLARWRLRRDLALASRGPLRPARLSSLRPGRPPGFKKRSDHAVDDLLRECHALALDILSPPRTAS